MGRLSQIKIVAIFLWLASGCNGHLYLGQKPPKDTPQIFAPGIISLPDRKEEVITFSADGFGTIHQEVKNTR